MSKIEFGPKSTTNDKKWFFGASLGPKDDPYLILDQFRQTKKKNFFLRKIHVFFKKVPKCGPSCLPTAVVYRYPKPIMSKKSLLKV